MFRYTLKRLAVGALTLTALATITFFLMKIIPGSPFGGQLAQLSPEVREMLYAQYNLDKSIPEQFMIYLQNAITGDFGDSMTRKGTAVTDIIARCLPATIKLGLAAFTIAITVGVTLGIVAAFTKRKWVENLSWASCSAGCPSSASRLRCTTSCRPSRWRSIRSR